VVRRVGFLCLRKNIFEVELHELIAEQVGVICLRMLHEGVLGPVILFLEEVVAGEFLAGEISVISSSRLVDDFQVQVLEA
jgi:hypothetical protein